MFKKNRDKEKAYMKSAYTNVKDSAWGEFYYSGVKVEYFISVKANGRVDATATYERDQVAWSDRGGFERVIESRVKSEISAAGYDKNNIYVTCSVRY